MENIVALPVLIPFLAAACLLCIRENLVVHRIVSFLVSLCILMLGGFLLWHTMHNPPVVLSFGNWISPFGIAFLADSFSALMVLITGIIALSSVVFWFWGIG